MKNWAFYLLLVFVFSWVLTGCEVIGDIFKAGVWVGLLIAGLVIGLIIYFMTRRKG